MTAEDYFTMKGRTVLPFCHLSKEPVVKASLPRPRLFSQIRSKVDFRKSLWKQHALVLIFLGKFIGHATSWGEKGDLHV